MLPIPSLVSTKIFAIVIGVLLLVAGGATYAAVWAIERKGASEQLAAQLEQNLLDQNNEILEMIEDQARTERIATEAAQRDKFIIKKLERKVSQLSEVSQDAKEQLDTNLHPDIVNWLWDVEKDSS